ncbi:osmoprotectant transport system ATP-binding protein [Bosea sp. BE271]|uniref:ABC transporter ATP-binding protein n=1 Tax=Bosea TaxID=85413 RepID=UPI00285C0C4B|nr:MULTISPECIES: ABC transporter ATP-binding protein [Bosea]MDR6830749.1 osmoprotectant transport system ATP-binding protein [Bosea robiniae]MDR6895406.1 osmoprotectant transport system ATP-binding protein [Bosea sp. BE109]MDR7138802.1 osmoprotectant transport system ATP-binding protein [Bosea sp. BE168]MDR7175503.1 osmoprotectant transport system ATP-binding protein [Bosea sp. BE271]
MIRLEGITKRFGAAGKPSVDDVTIEMPEGTTTALIGPSGCGKTTTMRMINRMIEPSAGRIFIEGQDVTELDPVTLRRRIGYVIQQIGLFPHMTVAENIATVPRLLGWTRAKTEERIDELLTLVGLDPERFRSMMPHRLSGGQRQRVGVARALAADPPVMLMDEPFGAIDPIARERLQDEFKEILKRVRKTIVMVTHDLDEAMKMGDRVAIMRDGRLIQYATPDEILAAPADSFVEAFVGPDRALKRLSLRSIDTLMRPGSVADAPAIASGASVREALARLIGSGARSVNVHGAEGAILGHVTRDAILDGADAAA